MHRPLKFATVVAVALAFTACADSARDPITGPDGISLAKGSTFTELTAAQLVLWSEIQDKTTELYCSGKLLTNAQKDVDKLRTYAEWSWWTAEDGAEDGAASHENVAYIAAKMIANNESNLASGKTCGDQEVVEDLTDLINLFLNQSELLRDPTIQALIVCPETGCVEPDYVSIPAGTFGELVSIIVRTNNQPFPNPDFSTVGPSLLYDVVPATAVANNPWTRCIRWESPEGTEGLPDVSTIRVVRQDEDGNPDILPTTVDACPRPTVTSSLFMRGVHKVFAGFPFFPKELHAYLPPRTFGGTSTASSPHFLTSLDPSNPFDALCLLTESYSPATANAGCGFLDKADECADTDAQCVNGFLDQYIQVVDAQDGQSLTTAQAQELRAAANALKVQDESSFLGIWNGRLTHESGGSGQPVTVIVTSQEGTTVTGDYRVALDCSPAPCDPELYNTDDRFFTGEVDGTTMTFTLEPFVSVAKAVVTLTRSENSLTGTHVDHGSDASTNTFNAALTLGETPTVVPPPTITGGPNLNVLTAPSAEGSKTRGAGLR